LLEEVVEEEQVVELVEEEQVVLELIALLP
jgi:hypothetical protein